MRLAFTFAMLFSLVAVGFADEPKPAKTADELLASLEGVWLEADHYKLMSPKEADKPKPDAKKADKPLGVMLTESERKGKTKSEWSLYLVFADGRKGYSGPAEKVEATGETLTFRLPPPGKDDDRRTIRAFTLKRVGETLEMEVPDGESKGKYGLVRLQSGHTKVGADEKTVDVVARVDGKTKTIDGKVYHLVAIRYRLILEFADPVLLDRGVLGQAELAESDPENALAGPGCLYRLLWLRLPDQGEVEVIWGDRDFPKEKDEDMRARLIKAGHKPYRVDVRKLPVVKTGGDADDLLETLDKLAEPTKRK